MCKGSYQEPNFGPKDLLGREESDVPFLQADCAPRIDGNYHIICKFRSQAEVNIPKALGLCTFRRTAQAGREEVVRGVEVLHCAKKDPGVARSSIPVQPLEGQFRNSIQRFTTYHEFQKEACALPEVSQYFA